MITGTNVDSLDDRRESFDWCADEPRRDQLFNGRCCCRNVVEFHQARRILSESSIEPVRGQMVCLEAKPQLTRHVIYSPSRLPRAATGRPVAGRFDQRKSRLC